MLEEKENPCLSRKLFARPCTGGLNRTLHGAQKCTVHLVVVVVVIIVNTLLPQSERVRDDRIPFVHTVRSDILCTAKRVENVYVSWTCRQTCVCVCVCREKLSSSSHHENARERTQSSLQAKKNRSHRRQPQVTKKKPTITLSVIACWVTKWAVLLFTTHLRFMLHEGTGLASKVEKIVIIKKHACRLKRLTRERMFHKR